MVWTDSDCTGFRLIEHVTKPLYSSLFLVDVGVKNAEIFDLVIKCHSIHLITSTLLASTLLHASYH